MKNQMKKAVSMLLSLAIVATSVPMQSVIAEDEILIVDETQDAEDAAPDEEVSAEQGVVIEEAQPVFEENNTEPLTEQDSESEIFETEIPESNLPIENETDESETDIETQETATEQVVEEEFIIGEDSAEIEMLAVEEIEALNLEEGEAALAEEVQSGDFTYTLLEDGTAEITGYTGEQSGDLVIPDVVAGYTVTSIGDYAFLRCSGFNGKLILPTSITNIGNGAFYGCSGFTGSLILQEGLTSVESYAFYECNGFTGKLELPESLTNIGENAFFCFGDPFREMELSVGEQKTVGEYLSPDMELPIVYGNSSNENVATVTAEGVVTGVGVGEATISVSICGSSMNIEVDVVSTTEDFKYVVLQDGTAKITGYTGVQNGDLIIPDVIEGYTVTSIGAYAFDNAQFEGSLTLPKYLVSIGKSAFFASHFTGNLILPESLRRVETDAFSFCEGFTGKLELPEALTDIGYGAFFCFTPTRDFERRFAVGEKGLPDRYIITNMDLPITYESSNEDIIIVDEKGIVTGVSAGKAYITLSVCGSSIDIEVEVIGSLSGEFRYSVLQDGTAEIIGYVGEPNGDLVIPDVLDGYAVTSVGENAFYGYGDFKGKLILPDSLKNIGDGAFGRCSGFTGDLILPGGITKIGEGAFCECSGFTGNLALPENLTMIGHSVFFNCSGFTGDLVFPENIISIGNNVFEGCKGFTGSLILPESLTDIGEGAFYDCSGFTGDLVLPKGLKNIGNYVFAWCAGFTGNLMLPEGLTSVGRSAFVGCRNFTGNLILPEGLTSIGDYAFAWCSGFIGILELPKTLVDIGYGAFFCFERPRTWNDMDLTIGKRKETKIISANLELPIVYKSSNEEVAIVDEEGTVTAVGEGEAYISFSVCGSEYNEKQKVIVSDPRVLYTTPQVTEFKDIWVGDYVYIGYAHPNANVEEDGWNYSLKSMEVISGSDLVSVEEETLDGAKYYKIHCNKEGTVKLRVNHIDECKKPPVDLELNIKKGTPLDMQIPTSIKLGESWKSIWKNLPYGSVPMIYLNEEDVLKVKCNYGGWGGPVGSFTREEQVNEFIYHYDSEWGHEHLTLANKAIYPGTITGDIYLFREDAEKKQNSLGTVTLTIEEPIIKSNIPQTVVVGDTLNLETYLENTAFENSAIPDESTPTENKILYYIPQIEIVEGKDCVSVLGEAGKTTLTLQQKLQFNKVGTVKIKVSYVPAGLAMEDFYHNNVYQPDKTFIVEVKAKQVTATFNSDEGSGVPSQTVDCGTCIKEPAAPKKSGYVFCGWYQGSTKFDFNNPVTEDITLTAKWEKQAVKVTSVKLNKTNLRLKKGQKQTLTATVKPSNATNKALTWTTSNKKVATVSNGKITAVGYGTATITAKAADGSGKSVSCKVKVGYGITYKLNGGKNNNANPAAYYKETVTLKNPTRKGYLFKGWYTDKKLKKKITKITKKSSKNLALYAKWEKITVGKASISSLKNSGKRTMTVNFKQVSKAAGYEVLYSTNKKFSRNNEKIVTKKKSLTIKKLKAKTTYYVKVRAYRTDSAGKKVYGKYSPVKKVTVKK